jgi:hypothetical protein
MEKIEYPNGVSVETDFGKGSDLVARVYVDGNLKKTFESETAHDEAGVFARVLVRVNEHRHYRN